MPRSTPFKARLAARENMYGFFIGLPAPATVEMAGYTGFDFVILDGEHGPAGLEMMEHMIRAGEASGLAPLMRVPSGSAADILHALDIGAHGIMVPHVTSAEVAADIVDKAYYSPRGHRGIGTLSRAARHGAMDRHEYLRTQHERTSVIVMVEDAEALPNLAGIAATKGVDAIFVGPSDLSSSLGYPGEFSHPEVQKALAEVVRHARANNLPVATTAGSAEEAKRLHGIGVQMICYSTASMLMNALKALRKGLDAP